MKFCQAHWDTLRTAVEGRGLMPLVARGGVEAASRAAAEIEGTATDATYDPLMACHWMIVNRVMETFGVGVLNADCPLCLYLDEHDKTCTEEGCIGRDGIEEYFINGPADAALEHVKGSAVLCAVLGWPAPDQEASHG